jgi:hypothetical protein
LGDVKADRLRATFRRLTNWHASREGERRSGRCFRHQAPSTGVLCHDRLERIVLTTAPVLDRWSIQVALLAILTLGTATCAHPNFFPGTTILRTEENQRIVDTVDQYRQRLTAKNVDGLLVMASEKYREDSGTPRSDDDYGYEGLRQVLKTRLTRVKSIWYEIEMRDIQVNGQHADVDVFLNGSFELAAPKVGDRYRRVNDYHRFVLERTGDKWKFLSGM